MKRLKILSAFVVLSLAGMLMTSCSSDDGESEEKGQIEQFTDKTADKAIKHIKTPLDSAKKAQELANQRTEQTKKNEEALK